MVSNDRNAFDDATATLADWGRTNGRILAIGIGAVIIIGGGVALWRSNVATKAARAEKMFFAAQGPLQQGDVAGAQQQLRQVAQRFDGTPGGTQAQLLLAQTLYDQGKYQDGIDVLAKASNVPDGMRTSVELLTAVGYEGLGKYDEAATRYERAANDAATPTAKAQLRADHARALQAGGKTTEALRVWRELAKEQIAGVSDEARVRAGELAAMQKG